MANLYSIDTSAFIHAWKRDYPPDVFPSVWRKIEQLIGEGRLVSCEEALLELERGDDDLYDWAHSNSDAFIQPDSEVQEIVGQIVNRWPNFLPDTSYDGLWADPYVIAFGAHRRGMVISGEVAVGNNSHKVKIPNICRQLGVPCGNMLDLLRRENFNF